MDLANKSEQLEEKLEVLKGQVKELSEKKEISLENADVHVLMRYMIEEREKTNRMLSQITAKIEDLEKEIDELYDQEDESYPDVLNNRKEPTRELPISGLDARVVDLVQSRGMICADELREFMNYRGRNAACARLKKLEHDGLLERYQLGHRVYYRINAGKATNTLIISPPQ